MFMFGFGVLIGTVGATLVAGYGCLHYIENQGRRGNS